MTTSQAIPMPHRKWLLRVGLPIVILMAAATILLMSSWRALMPAVTVRTVPVVMREVETNAPVDSKTSEIIQAPGWVEAEPYSVYATALTEGVIESILVLAGDSVEAGQPVARLVSDDAQLSVRQADAMVDKLQADLNVAGARLAKLPTRVKAAQADLGALQDEYDRKQKLVERGAVAEGPVQRLALKLTAAQARIDELLLDELVLQGGVETAAALLRQGQAQRDKAQLRLDRMTVYSPITGVVMERLASPGSRLMFSPEQHSSHVLHLYDPTQLQVRADVPLAQAAKVSVGHPAEIIVDVLPGTSFSGTIIRFVHRADLQKNTVEAKIHINDPSHLLKPDMLARVRITQPQQVPGEIPLRRVPRVFVPRDSVDAGGSVSIIEDLKGGIGIARSRVVTLGDIEVDGWIEVVSGLSPGDRVILDDVEDGATVQVEGN